MTLLAESGGAAVHHAAWRDLLPIVAAGFGCDSVIVDAPYSARTHAGAYETSDREAADGGERRAIDYASWTPEDVHDFVRSWEPITTSWMVSITDDVLAHHWREAYESVDWCTFPMIPCIERGSGVRMSGDGPSSVTTFAVVARRRCARMAKWGTLPGFYDNPREKKPIVGGKPLSLMRSLVCDYTRPGDLVVDPCCGAGTTLVAARALGRRAIGGDAMLEHAEIAAERIRALPTAADKRGTLALFGSVG